MLTLFLLKSGDPKNTDRLASVKSLAKITEKVVIVEDEDNKFLYVNNTKKETDWYAILYDNEYVDDMLSEAIPIFLEQCKADVLVFYRKKNKKLAVVHKCPRIFRKDVRLKFNSLMPVQPELVFETVLNGWLLERAK